MANHMIQVASALAMMHQGIMSPPRSIGTRGVNSDASWSSVSDYENRKISKRKARKRNGKRISRAKRKALKSGQRKSNK